MSGMSPAEQSFVQPERETCEVRLEVFVSEKVAKKNARRWTRGKKRERGQETGTAEGRKGRKEKGRKDGRKDKVWRRDHEISVNRKSGGGLRARRSRFNAR